ncbi:hypothetical protein HK098_007641 [Nowakowskiella sp. JEL0407]|nr:hypothetical protein HK098_007641 [Nowakowskiella sp. JEL0407]
METFFKDGIENFYQRKRKAYERLQLNQAAPRHKRGDVELGLAQAVRVIDIDTMTPDVVYLGDASISLIAITHPYEAALEVIAKHIDGLKKHSEYRSLPDGKKRYVWCDVVSINQKNDFAIRDATYLMSYVYFWSDFTYIATALESWAKSTWTVQEAVYSGKLVYFDESVDEQVIEDIRQELHAVDTAYEAVKVMSKRSGGWYLDKLYAIRHLFPGLARLPCRYDLSLCDIIHNLSCFAPDCDWPVLVRVLGLRDDCWSGSSLFECEFDDTVVLSSLDCSKNTDSIDTTAEDLGDPNEDVGYKEISGLGLGWVEVASGNPRIPSNVSNNYAHMCVKPSTKSCGFAIAITKPTWYMFQFNRFQKWPEYKDKIRKVLGYIAKYQRYHEVFTEVLAKLLATDSLAQAAYEVNIRVMNYVKRDHPALRPSLNRIIDNNRIPDSVDKAVLFDDLIGVILSGFWSHEGLIAALYLLTVVLAKSDERLSEDEERPELQSDEYYCLYGEGETQHMSNGTIIDVICDVKCFVETALKFELSSHNYTSYLYWSSRSSRDPEMQRDRFLITTDAENRGYNRGYFVMNVEYGLIPTKNKTDETNNADFMET